MEALRPPGTLVIKTFRHHPGPILPSPYPKKQRLPQKHLIPNARLRISLQLEHRLQLLQLKRKEQQPLPVTEHG